MKFGIVPLLTGDSGGVYQYSLMMLEALRNPGTISKDDQVTIFVHESASQDLSQFVLPNWEIRPLSPPSLRRTLGKVLHALPFGSQLSKLFRPSGAGPQRIPQDISHINFKPELGAWFRRFGVDLMIFPVPMSISFECGIPYIFVVHDLQHRLQPHFPEVGSPREFQAREYLFMNGIANAVCVVADSEVGREDVLACYGATGVSANNVFALPFVPPAYLPEWVSADRRQAVRRQYNLPDNFFFYPAQFWPHKNHARLLMALALLRDKYGIHGHLVLCGSHSNEVRSQTFKEVQELIEQHELNGQVHYLGYVLNEDMAVLYAEALALVMPTFFGPTNIPILEAWTLLCPVLTSNIRGVRDQALDGAILVNPDSVEDIAQGLHKLWTDEAFRIHLCHKGTERLKGLTQQDFADRLSLILKHAKRTFSDIRVKTHNPASYVRDVNEF
ncbi:MAG: glycosyltransferase family 4 protein [Alphaproteobacteria bacterium]|nr:glycosyltransferase family 4 protein [Alphaproteobacteria bacterium]